MNEREEIRGRILEAAYQDALKAGGIDSALFMNDGVAKKLGLDATQTRDALTSLKANALLETVTSFFGGGELLRITPIGFQQVERLRDEGYKPHKADAAQETGSIYVTFNGNVYGQAIQGAGSTANITQTRYATDPQVLDLLERILLASQEIEDYKLRAEAVESTEALESELKAEQPNPGKVRTLARGLWAVVQGSATLSGLVTSLMTLLRTGAYG